ncbi:MAG: DUF2752 domain-containing protein [Spirulinaceae cyanobacterium]
MSYPNLFIALAVAIAISSGLMGIIPLPACPFETFLGICCPMCGSTRAWLSLFEGKVLTAFRYNPIFWLWGFWVCVSYITLWEQALRPDAIAWGEKTLKGMTRIRPLLYLHLFASAATFIYLNTPAVVQWRG